MKPITSMYKQSRSGLPLVSVSVAAISLLLYFCRDATIFLQYDRALIASGELWRIVTGHLTHWSFDHFLWCTVTFIALGSVCEQLNRKGFVISLAASAVIIPAVSWFADPDMLYYRGLSGICSSVFTAGSILIANKAFADKNWINLIIPVAGGTLFFSKILYEFITGQAVFVHTDNLFFPVPLAHLTGGIIGLLSVVFTLAPTHKQPR